MAEREAMATDEDLARRARQGDPEALRELHDRYQPWLRSRARRRLVGRLRRKVGDSDVVQDTFLTLFRRLDRFEDRGPGSFRHWLLRILERRGNDALKHHVLAGKRSTRRETSQGATGAPAEAVARDASPSVHAARDEERAAALAAIDAMTPDHRQVLLLVHVHGHSFVQAAGLMSRSPDATRKLYGRAVQQLTRRLAEMEADGR